MFTRGEWAKLVEMSLEASIDAVKKNSRARRRDQDTIELSQLRDQSRRPAMPREALPEDLSSFTPEQDFVLEEGWFVHNLRKARRGAAPGPSGMTAHHLRPLLDVSADSLALGQVAALFSRAQVPLEIMDALGAGRLTALRKPDGGIRGIVVGEIFRRITARTVAQQYTKKVEVATAPPFSVRFEDQIRVRDSGAHLASAHRAGPTLYRGIC